MATGLVEELCPFCVFPKGINKVNTCQQASGCSVPEGFKYNNPTKRFFLLFSLMLC